jgi:hypothetical protein
MPVVRAECIASVKFKPGERGLDREIGENYECQQKTDKKNTYCYCVDIVFNKTEVFEIT